MNLRGNETPTYPQLIELYADLARTHEEIELYNMGTSDFGLPIYLCIINGAGDSTATFNKAKNATTVLINNAIHPGEPDGVNACLLWIEDWILAGKKTKDIPVIAIIPAYNVGGMMNRSGTSRANQNGPVEYGFRGNAQNLDLNRDCIKMDSKNMYTFVRIYHALEPDVFMDTHVTNGADYQYTMTYISSVRERMPKELGDITYNKLIPYLEKHSTSDGFELIPYVNLKGETPESGIEQFNDLPRYIQGYAALFHSISFTLETHMLKPFQERVKATRVFIEHTINWTALNQKIIESARKDAFNSDRSTTYFPRAYQLNSNADSILFLGYEHSYDRSDVTDQDRLKYHRDKPYAKNIPYYGAYEGIDSIKVPTFYILGRQCHDVVDRLKANGVEMSEIVDVEDRDLITMRIQRFESPQRPYEGHFLHSSVEVIEEEMRIKLKKGDFLIPTDQDRRRFIISVLEPGCEDSYFCWNYFDSYVQQKEYFSPYVFEEKAKELLESDSKLKELFEEKKANDPEFRASRWDQLYFLYRHSNYYEPSVNLLPVYKLY